jgi:hypothetical protein
MIWTLFSDQDLDYGHRELFRPGPTRFSMIIKLDQATLIEGLGMAGHFHPAVIVMSDDCGKAPFADFVTDIRRQDSKVPVVAFTGRWHEIDDPNCHQLLRSTHSNMMRETVERLLCPPRL